MILDELAAYAQQRVLADKQAHPLEELKQRCETVSPRTPFAFEQALRADALSFICEVKKASPSKGIIAQDFPYLDIAKQYEQAGADCISCLTEPKWFLGSDAIYRHSPSGTDTDDSQGFHG